jgi:hypothetical protein
MTAQELAEYSGKIYLARCTFASTRAGNVTIPVDYECPTPELRDAAVWRGRARVGVLLSRTDVTYWRQQTGPKWAKAFGGLNGRCGTDPGDVPDTMMTAAEFWRDHANKNGSA